MPLYDFRCRACGREFEALVRPHDAEGVACPECRAADVEQLLSTFAVSSQEKTRAAVDRKRKQEAAVARRDNAAMERELERHRLEDH
jgi:putative FmdB family regulatory protein